MQQVDAEWLNDAQMIIWYAPQIYACYTAQDETPEILSLMHVHFDKILANMPTVTWEEQQNQSNIFAWETVMKSFT